MALSLQIYGTSRSRAFRVLWTVEELGLEFEHIPLSWKTCRSNERYRTINPSGTIPSICDDGFVLAESLAINLYLAQKAGRLWPATLADQALVLQWSFWVVASVEPAATRWASHTSFLPESLRDAVVAEAAAAELQDPLNRLEAHLSQSRWMLEGGFSLADLNVASVMVLVQNFERDIRPNIVEWLDRCSARPAFRLAQALP